MFAVPHDRIARIHASSGTTGKPTVVGYTSGDLDTWSDVMARSIRAAGGRPGMRVHVAYGYGLFTGGLGAHYGAERLGCAVIPVSGGMTERQVQLIHDFEPDIIMVTPSYMLAILDDFRRAGIDPRASQPQGRHLRRRALDQRDARPRSSRASTCTPSTSTASPRSSGPASPCECVETKDGPHVWEDHFYPEIIDPETGAVLPDGETGELVLHLAHQGSHADRSATAPAT